MNTDGSSEGVLSPGPRAPWMRRPWGKFLLYWLPVILWCAVIFGFSSDSGSSRHSSRIIGPLLRWMFPGIAEATVDRVHTGVRKLSHVSEYALLAMLAWRARRKPAFSVGAPWRRNEALFALVFCALFAATDEIHQLFVPSREGRVLDVLIDSTGAAAGVLLVWAWGRWRKRW